MNFPRILTALLIGFVLPSASAMGLNPGVKKQVVAYPGGSPRIVYHYYVEDGKKVLHGDYREFSTSGELLKKFHYERGVLDGDAEEFYSSGRRKWSGRFFEGRRVGRWIFRGKDGRKKIEGDFGPDGRIRFIKHFHPNGRIKKKEIYREGRIAKILSWNMRGERQPDQLPEAVRYAPDYTPRGAFPEASLGVEPTQNELEEMVGRRSTR
jgi:antitoxin component YwqK of YwqJK toxin-antitoxin module